MVNHETFAFTQRVLHRLRPDLEEMDPLPYALDAGFPQRPTPDAGEGILLRGHGVLADGG